jgi:hypothetical protein
MASLSKIRHDLFANQPASADDDDFHGSLLLCPLYRIY